ncbi:MAG TPA: branched-chain amino acid ABC transporter ATP-binding protein/permease [Steroidobacteraceae bacterium]|nr:branched-chain amino acid ABC transporter ATP-binding protein/permease [Steroidobacteraceae bacterium]
MLRLRTAGMLGRWLPELAALVSLVLFPFVFPIIGGTFDMMDRILIWGLFGLGFDILFGVTGLLSFGQAAFYGIGGFTTAYLLISGALTNAVVALIAGTILASSFGLIIGVLSLRRAGIYFAMLTLAFGEMFYFLDMSPLSKLTGGENGLSGVPPAAIGFGILVRTPEEMYWLIALLFFMGFVLARRIVNSPFGAILVAIRDNIARVGVLGHDVQKYKLTAFVIAAAYGGLAGGLLGLFQGYMPPDAFYLETSGQLVVQTIMGGAGTLIGPTIGAAVWVYLRSELQQVDAIGGLWKMVLGIVFVLIVALLRKGICGGISVLWRRFTATAPAPLPGLAVDSAVAARARVPATVTRKRSTLTGPIILEAKNVVKRYGGLTAVDDVSFQLAEGEIRALIGPNGAGKTTFFNMLAGTVPVTQGEIHFAGEQITRLGSTAVCQRGLAKSFQINQLFPSLSVRDNIRISALGRRYGKFYPSMLRDLRHDADIRQATDEAIEAVDLSDCSDAPAIELAYGEKRRLEIGLALATKPRVLLLDEPTAGMSPSERAVIVQLLKHIAAGMTIVIVEHDMDVVFGLADRVTVLLCGRKIAEGSPEAIQANAEVRAAYLGSPAGK